MDLDLDGKVAVVTGAGKGIGLAVTMALAQEGAQVIAGSRTTGSLDGLRGVTPMAVDLSAADGPARLIQRAIQEHGQVDVLVNNVGAVRMRTEGFLGTSDEDFAWAMRLNFFIALRASRAALTEMTSRGAGAIINVASVNAFFQPDAATVDYGAAKAALVNLTKTGIVSRDAVRLRRQVIAARVRCDDPESSRRERLDLPAPPVPELGETVQQDDQRPLAGLDVVQSLVADLGVPLVKLGACGHHRHPRG